MIKGQDPTTLMGVIVAEKRKQERLHLEEFPTLIYQGEACLLVDVSLTGLGITFISDEDWPENITLEYSLPKESGRKWLLPCHTVWRSSSDFYKVASRKTIRRRGLEFVDPNSEDVDELFHHLDSKTAGNPGSEREM